MIDYKMVYSMKKIYIVPIIALLAAGCSVENKRSMGVSIRQDNTKPAVDCQKVARDLLKEKVYYPLGIIGQSEPVYLKDMKTAFPARIDTGAETSSIDASNIKEFERDGESWVAFDVENRITKEKKRFEKKIARRTTIKRQQGGDEKRLVVNMEIKMGDQLFTKEFTLGNRKKFEYQVLIGRNILNGLAIVDVAIKNSLN